MSQSRCQIFLASCLVTSMVLACGPSSPPERPTGIGDLEPEVQIFRDVTGSAGIDFQHVNGASGKLHSAEIMGSGAAWLDVDGDGDLDLFLLQGNHEAMQAGADSAGNPGRRQAPRDRLLRNELIPKGQLSFTDTTEASGIEGSSYSMGVAVGDVDQDGDDDLYVTVFGGADRLWLAVGNGTFVDGTVAAGLGDPRWTTSAAWADFDGDGWLDLVVAAYLSFRFDAPPCHSASSARDYCGPASYPALVDRLYRNLGPDAEGRVSFTDVTKVAGLGATRGPGLGVIAADFDGDGRLDIYVANDTGDNRLWRNLGGEQRQLAFIDDALLSGCATNGAGSREGSMGIAVGDVDRDGDDEILVTHLASETDTFYSNQGGGIFRDRTRAVGLAAPSLSLTNFGTAFLDADNDGWLDLVVASGAVRLFSGRADGEGGTLYQPNHLFLQRPKGAGEAFFEEVGERAGAAFAVPDTSRGLAVADIDNDGDLDLLVTNNGGRARLLLNQLGQEVPWLGLVVVVSSGSTALGARIGIHRRQGPTLWRRVHSDGSYLSASDSRVLVGLGDDPEVTAIEVRWIGGAVEEFGPFELGRYHAVQRGAGRPRS